MSFLKQLKRFWRFVWYDDSPLSWIVAIIFAFLIVKFIVFPLLGFALGTEFPVVAVLSSSMDHNGVNLDRWWEIKKDEYEDISKEDFNKYIFKNGFSKGDIIFLIGEDTKDINIGDVIVFRSNSEHPIIHRVIDKWNIDGEYHFRTKGDNNEGSYSEFGERDITKNRIIGKALFRVPLLGWIKIVPEELIKGG